MDLLNFLIAQNFDFILEKYIYNNIKMIRTKLCKEALMLLNMD